MAPDHANSLAANKFADDVAKNSGGRIKVEVFPANQLGEVKDVIEYLMTGSVHMYIGGTSETSLFQPEWGVMDCPYLIRDLDHLLKVSKSDVIKEIVEKMDANRGVRILRSDMYYGARHLTTLKKEIKTPADLRGMLIRAPDQPVYLAAVRAMGGTPTPVAFGDLYMALKQGVVDGQENPIATIFSMRYYEVQKFVSLDGHTYEPAAVLINPNFFNKLSDKHKEIVVKAAEKARDQQRAELERLDAERIEAIKKAGVTIEEKPDVAAFK
ncbi:MAG: TRAP transporter substrate-binding protein, partial [Spirochaetaceae bacterium]|nr:TRAP transporter substrate-binding protein [Spirochaetaceae bacterium]